MAYSLKEITIRTNNTAEGMKKIAELWRMAKPIATCILPFNNQWTCI